MKTETTKYIYVGLVRVCKDIKSNKMWLEYDAGDGEWLEVELENVGDLLDDVDPTLLVMSMVRMMQA